MCQALRRAKRYIWLLATHSKAILLLINKKKEYITSKNYAIAVKVTKKVLPLQSIQSMVLWFSYKSHYNLIKR